MGQKLAPPYLYGNRFDPQTQKRVNQVGVKCSKCSTEEWHPAPGPGWGRRIFKNRKWSLSNSPNKHVCPICEDFRVSGIHRTPAAAEGRVVTFPSPELSPVLLTQNMEPPVPVVHDPMNTQLQEALAPVREKLEAISKSDAYYKDGASAASGARQFLLKATGQQSCFKDVHFKVEQDAVTGKWRYVLLNAPADAMSKYYSGNKPGPVVGTKLPPRDGHVARVKRLRGRLSDHPMTESTRVAMIRRGTQPGAIVNHLSNATLAGMRMVRNLGVGEPEVNKHFRIRRAGGKHFYELLTPELQEAYAKATGKWLGPPLAVTKWGGYLSSYDARKAAVTHLGTINGGQPKEGVDFWVGQESDNLWSYATVKPGEEPKRVPPPEKPTLYELAQQTPAEPIIEAQPLETHVSDVSTQDIRAVVEELIGADDFQQPAETPPMPEGARQPTIADRRRIRAEIEDKYDEDKQSYAGSWTDQKLAAALDVPRIWVSQVRENYGPDRNQEADIRAQAERMATKRKMDDAISLAMKAQGIAQIIMSRGQELNGVLEELQAKKAELGL